MKLPHQAIISFFIALSVLPVFAFAQTDNDISELRVKIAKLKLHRNYLKDTAYANALSDLAYIYSFINPDSALILLSEQEDIYHKTGNKKGETDTYILTGDAYKTKGLFDKAIQNYESAFAIATKENFQNTLPLVLNRMGTIRLNQGNYPEALSKFYASRRAAESIQNNTLLAATINNIAIVHFYQDQFADAENDYRQLLAIAKQLNDTNRMSLAYNGLGEVNLQQKNPAKALQNLSVAYSLASQTQDAAMMLTITLTKAEAYYHMDSLQKALSLFEEGLRLAKQTDNSLSITDALLGMAKTQYKQGLLKEALANALGALQRAQAMGHVQLMRDANEITSHIYESSGDNSKALGYYKAYKTYSDSLNSLANERASATEKANYEFSKREARFKQETLQQKWTLISAVIALLLLSVILWLINRNRRRLNHSNKELQRKNILIEVQKTKAEDTLLQLQATQTQLIQSEKMASLGELTAGIAHEIQNPLNFVNNFSEVNTELIDEMDTELSNGDIREASLIADNIRQNLKKIHHHGKRADAIVKGMLQHSRQVKGVKESTVINTLCDEYLRLSYHGLRAKDKSFNTELKTDFDNSIGAINVMPQDIGRVLLNLFNNAFYAVNEKKKLSDGSYQPVITVATVKINNIVRIVITDNGNGIPQPIIDKIFQPFFTTKPTGQGTGLGLSLAYDIITKEHGGTLQVRSRINEGSEFIIQLPQ